MKTTRLDPGASLRARGTTASREKIGADTAAPATAETAASTTTAADDTVGVSASARKAIGALEHDQRGRGTGAAAALHGLDVVEKKPSRFRAGVAAALIGITLIGAMPQGARADTLGATPPPVATQALPLTTGPPAAGTSLLATRIDQMTTPTAVVASDEADAAIQAQTRAALERFQAQVEHILLLDAAGLAASHNTFDPDRPLTDAQQQQLKDALGTLVGELPVGALSPEIADLAKDALRSRGLSTEGIDARPVKDLKKVARDVVKDVVRDWEAEHQTAGKAIRTLWIGGALAAGYLQGSDAMKSVGVKPEARFKLLDGKVRAKLGGEWEAKLANPAMYLALSSSFPVQVGSSRLNAEVSARVDAAGPTFGQLQASGFTLTGALSGTLDDGAAVALHGNAKLEGSGALDHVSVSGSWSKAPYTVGAGASYFAQTDRFVGSLSVGYKPSNDLEVFVQGSHDTRGESAIGVGLRLRF